jgi:hypothetical protein
MRKPLYLALVGLLGSTSIAAATDSVRVRLDRSDLVATEALGVTPMHRTDYANFVVLELSRADADALLARSANAIEIADAGRIRFNQVNFDPLRDAQPAKRGVLPTTAAGKGLSLVQFNAPMKQDWRDRLERSGLRVLQYYPHDTFLVWGSVDAVAETVQEPHVRWQGGFLADYKINPDLAHRQGRIKNVDVHFYNDGNIAGVVEALKALGAHVLTHAPAQPDRAFYDAWIEVDADRLDAIANLPQVVAVAYASPKGHFDDEMSDQILAGNYNAANQPQIGYAPWLTGFGYDGTGVIMGVVDSGVDLGHPDLAPRIVGGYTFPGCSSPAGGDDNANGGHGTHVAGIIAGQAIGDGAGATVAEADANGFLYGLGVARGAQIYAMATVDCGAPWPPAEGWQELSKRSLAGNTIGFNGSWTTGEGAAHGYQASERTFDTMVRDGDFDAAGNQPLVIAFSAGNSGPGASTLTAPKEAKNPIVTASSQNFRAGSINTIANTSSRGPAVDGRTLPNIASPGQSIASTSRRAGGPACATGIAGTANHYALCSGTSMASPHTAGSVAILTQWWRANHGGATPSPAMAKALLVNGALDMDVADVPNNNEGWGRVNLPRTIDTGTPQVARDQTDTLDNTGDVITLPLDIADPAKPVRVTVAWTDAPGAVGANPALVNNLDLEVASSSNIYRGNVMAAGVSASGGKPDALNNVENVFLPTGASGTIGVTVKATNLPGDGVPGTGDATDQDFAFVCDNCTLRPNFTLYSAAQSQAVCAPASASYTLNVGSVLGFTGAVALTTANVPAGGSASVSPTSAMPGGTATATLTGTAGMAPGVHTFNVVGTASSGTQNYPLTIDLATATPAAGTLTAPANGATAVHPLPTLQWDAIAQAKTYRVEIATDAAFSNVVVDRTVSATQLVLDVALDPLTTYHWRVRGDNVCGPGALSSASFTTSNLICAAPNLAVTDNLAAGVNDDKIVATAGTLTDLDLSLQMTHSYPGDLKVTLTNVTTNTSLIIGNRLGGSGCSRPNVDATWNDASATAMACRTTSPGIGGDIRPTNALSLFNGTALAGTWRLNVADVASGDTGIIKTWCLKPTYDRPDVIFANGFQ